MDLIWRKATLASYRTLCAPNNCLEFDHPRQSPANTIRAPEFRTHPLKNSWRTNKRSPGRKFAQWPARDLGKHARSASVLVKLRRCCHKPCSEKTLVHVMVSH